MLKAKKLLTVAFAAVLGLSIVGCEGSFSLNPNKKNPVQDEVDFTNYTDYSVKVKNETSKNVVCFYGAPSEKSLISGVRATDQAGLKRVTSLFGDESKDFALFVVTEEDYKAAKASGDWETLKNQPFARIYAFYNATAENNNNVYTISKSMGGNYKLYLNNMTNYNVEIRKDGLYGPSLAYSAKMTLKTTIGVEGGEYDLFPVFRKFDKATGEIISSFPKTKNKKPYYFGFSLDNDTTEYEIDAEKFLTTENEISPSMAQLTINNQSETGISLYEGNGATPTQTESGGKKVNSGKQLVYSVKMASLGKEAFESERMLDSWQFGTSAQKYKIPTNTFKAGYRYVLNVTGTTYDDLTGAFAKNADGTLVAYKMPDPEED